MLNILYIVGVRVNEADWHVKDITILKLNVKYDLIAYKDTSITARFNVYFFKFLST